MGIWLLVFVIHSHIVYTFMSAHSLTLSRSHRSKRFYEWNFLALSVLVSHLFMILLIFTGIVVNVLIWTRPPDNSLSVSDISYFGWYAMRINWNRINKATAQHIYRYVFEICVANLARLAFLWWSFSFILFMNENIKTQTDWNAHTFARLNFHNDDSTAASSDAGLSRAYFPWKQHTRTHEITYFSARISKWYIQHAPHTNTCV